MTTQTTKSLKPAFATCPKGLESLLKGELEALGAEALRETAAGVGFEGDRPCLYRVCLWSRLANRVLLPLAEFPVEDADSLYAGMQGIPWCDHMRVTSSFAVDFSGTSATLTDPRFSALKCKDAIVDQFRDQTGVRPNVDTREPQCRISVRLHRGRARASLDLSGESLHKRGYRQGGGAAPLKENLASALLLRAGWPEIAAAGGALLDPMCGSGTLLIEGAWMAMDIAPGLLRREFGLQHWLGFREDVWQTLRDEAEARRADALQRSWPELRGYDASGKVLQIAEQNIAAAGLDGKVRVSRKELARFTRPTHRELSHGLVISNPPYGERVGDEASLVHLYHHFGSRLKEEFRGWRAALITGNPELGKTMGLRATRQYQFFNGTIPSKLLLFDISERHFVGQRSPPSSQAAKPSTVVLSAGAQMFANRLRKNHKSLRKWLRDEAIDCFRLYDADMPEYAVAVDVYGDRVHVAEYRAPATVAAAAAEQRLRDVLVAIPEVLPSARERIVIKQRQRQKGRAQYARRASTGVFHEVREGAVRLLVNLDDYLDTGLFLDHRPLRLELARLCAGKRFLNLYCYTGSATVHAAVGGARFSTSVDLSATYLDWARRNLALNGIAETRHQLVRADGRTWLRENSNRYDVVLLDPPTFSNSKRLPDTLDLQRDHAALIRSAAACLAEDGQLVFSSNQRKFELDAHLLEGFRIEDVTDWSTPRDFAKSRQAHRCWFIRHA